MKEKVIRVFLQARLSSTRLPCKILLPVAGIPLLELSFKRASNQGHDVRIVTSIDKSDDLLSNFLLKKNIPFFRGSLDDVLSRFYECSNDLAEDDIIVRLTGDNVLPDGKFINLAIQELTAKKAKYIRSNMDFYPYGLSVEVFYKKYLDEAFHNARTPDEREHVTPFIRNKYGDLTFGSTKTYYPRRVTVDYYSDYLLINDLFENVNDPINDVYDQILNDEEPNNSHLTKFILGSAQFGNKYGISSSGLVDPKTSHAILETACNLGINILDTAHGYGESEGIIGSYLKIKGAGNFFTMTKLDPSISEKASVEDAIKASVYESLFKLKVDKIDIVMFHRAYQVSEISLNALNHLRKEGYIGKIGVSINSPAELNEVLKWKEIEHIQLPSNILDHRWRKGSVVTLLEKFSDGKKTIHARSAFLQGLMFIKEASKWPRLQVSYDPSQIIDKIKTLEEKRGSSISELSLKYLLNLSWISGIVIGVENSNQLKELSVLFKNASLIKDLTPAEITLFDSLPEELLTPSKWMKNEI